MSPEAMQAALSFLHTFFGHDGPPPPIPDGRNTPRPPVPTAQPQAQLPADLYATADHVVLSIGLPGLPGPEAVSLRLLSPTELLVECWLSPPPGMALLQELPTGWIARPFLLPAPVVPESLVTRYEAGVLTLTFGRHTPQPPVQTLHGQRS